ncbi:MAG: helix-turn-helix transcriptional regulator [Spirochaetota bacterium]
MISAILIFVLIILAVLARRYIERGGGFVYCVTGLFLTFVGSLNETISYATQREQIFWASVGLILAVFGISLVLCCYRVTLGVGARIVWNLTVAGANAVGVLVSFFLFIDFWGMKTVCFSISGLCLAIPVLWGYRRSKERDPLSLQFGWSLGIFSAISILRLIFASLDLRRDLFISDEADAWLYLIIELSAIFSFIAFIAHMLPRRRNAGDAFIEREQERLSLSARGLTEAEIRCILAVLSGKSIKEIASDFGIQPSTVRNTLSHAYPKLEVKTLVELFALGGRYHIVA